jgi:16S rRNA (cytosine1402-N4)-methyltransferase
VESTWQHTTVLLNEAVDALLTKPDGTYIDATFGRGGHSRLILSRLDESGRLIAFDKDTEAVAVANAIEDTRGFSFRGDGPLDMRMDTTRGESVAEWLSAAEAGQIAEVIRDYGEERFAVQIAKAIVARRQERGPLSTTAELAQLVAGTVKTREPGQDPATRTFQALRIFINAELEELQQALEASLDILQPQGRLVVISFHSLEDRIVKQFITRHSKEVFDRRAPFAAPKAMKLHALGRVKPSADEVAANPRSRSAIMRVAERTDA